MNSKTTKSFNEDATNKPVLPEKKIHARFYLNYTSFTLDVDVQFPPQGVTALFGESGSGKTSFLRCLAGLEKPETGELNVNGITWQSHKKFMPAHRRPIGYVFQEASLFDHLSARDNLTFATKRATKTKNPIAFEQAVTLLGIDHLLDRKPHQLSGGERQRVAIARALLIQPRLLLMDEPLAALDLPRKKEILPYLERLKESLNLPIVYVSHAADEIARLADHVIAMKNGKVVSTGSLRETLSRLDFPIQLGNDLGVVLSAIVVERDHQWKLVRVKFSGGDIWLRDEGYTINSLVRIRILARDVSLTKEKHSNTSILNTLPATIEEIASDEHEAMKLVRVKLHNTNPLIENKTLELKNQNLSHSLGHNSDNHLVSRVTARSVNTLNIEPKKTIWVQIKSAAVI